MFLSKLNKDDIRWFYVAHMNLATGFGIVTLPKREPNLGYHPYSPIQSIFTSRCKQHKYDIWWFYVAHINLATGFDIATFPKIEPNLGYYTTMYSPIQSIFTSRCKLNKDDIRWLYVAHMNFGINGWFCLGGTRRRLGNWGCLMGPVPLKLETKTD